MKTREAEFDDRSAAFRGAYSASLRFGMRLFLGTMATDPSCSGFHPNCGGEDATAFAPARRNELGTVRDQAALFSGNPLASAMLEGGIHCMVVLNQSRQIVATSRNLSSLARGKTIESLLGLRFGEALGCAHAFECPNGCGTTEACAECGAIRASLAALRGESARGECRISRIVDGEFEALDLDVMATPFEIGDQRFAIVSISDVSNEKRRRALERIFFHDLINLAGGIEGLLGDLRVNAPSDLLEDVELSYSMTHELIEEIVSQRDLAAAERAELKAQPAMTNSLALVRKIAAAYQSHPECEQREIVVDSRSESLEFVTDPRLLTRVLGNLVKNAAEASERGQTVTLGCRLGGLKLTFWVHNPGVMTRDVQLQVFQRSFTTKGAGRGLGTYSVKLLTERCLEGAVAFESSEETGTTFRVILPLVIH